MFATQSRAHFMQRGQVALISLLIMVVLLTVGISVSTRTTQDLRLTQTEQLGGQSFQAAESGIEEALSLPCLQDGTCGEFEEGTLSSLGGANVNYTLTKQTTLNSRLKQGNAVQINVTGAVDGNQLAIDWGFQQGCSGAPNQNASTLLVRVYNNEGGVWVTRHLALAACSYTGSYPQNATTGQNGFPYRGTISLKEFDQFVRIEPIFNDTSLFVSAPGWDLPTASYQARSVAKIENTNESKAIEVTQSVPSYPVVFDYVLYSGTTIAK